MIRRSSRTCLLVGLVGTFLLLASMAMAADPSAWYLTPDMVNGLGFSSETRVPSIVADDFELTAGLHIATISWCGCYWVPKKGVTPNSDSLPNGTAGGVTAFTLKIWDNVAADPMDPFSFAQPGNILWSGAFDTAQFTEALYGTTALPRARVVYKYTVDVNSLPIPVLAAGTYWLSVEATQPEPTAQQWGWHESANHDGAAAVQDFKDTGWYTVNNNLYDSDMSFEITTTPEPGSISVLLIGAAGLVGGILRKRA